jgi:V8-like Glu-specific endopeptidase
MQKIQRALWLFILVAGLCGGCEPGESDETDLSESESPLVIGADERLRVTDSVKTLSPYRNVVAIRPDPFTATSSCTAFKIGPRHLLSAAHCFYQPLSGGGFGMPVALANYRLAYGQYGSGNTSASFPVVGYKISIQGLYVPPTYISSSGANQQDDWAILRVADTESAAGWFRAITPLTDSQVTNDFVARYASGYPLDGTLDCQAAPTSDHRCGGYQYYASLKPPFTFATYFIGSQTDWGVGQSGGPVYGSMPGVSQFVTIGLIAYSGTSTSYTLRLTNTITSQICTQIRAYPSTSYPTHECGP